MAGMGDSLGNNQSIEELIMGSLLIIVGFAAGITSIWCLFPQIRYGMGICGEKVLIKLTLSGVQDTNDLVTHGVNMGKPPKMPYHIPSQLSWDIMVREVKNYLEYLRSEAPYSPDIDFLEEFVVSELPERVDKAFDQHEKKV